MCNFGFIEMLDEEANAVAELDKACKTSNTHPIFQACRFCLVKKKKILHLQINSQIGKTIKKLW